MVGVKFKDVFRVYYFGLEIWSFRSGIL